MWDFEIWQWGILDRVADFLAIAEPSYSEEGCGRIVASFEQATALHPELDYSGIF